MVWILIPLGADIDTQKHTTEQTILRNQAAPGLTINEMKNIPPQGVA